MAVTADRVVVELEAKLDGYNVKVADAERRFTKSMGTIEKSAGSAERSVIKSFAAIGAKATLLASTALAAVGGAIASMAVQAVRGMAELQKAAEALGVTAQALQQYDYAAQAAGVSQEEMRKGLASLNDMLGQAALGAEKPNKIFQALGISIKDASGKVRDAATVFPQLADRLNAIPDPAQKAATAALFFGDNAAALKPLLDQGSEGIDGLRDAAERLGIVLSDRQLQDADKLAKKLDDLKLVLSSSIRAAVVDNADAIITLANSFISLAAAIPGAIDAWKRWRLENGINFAKGVSDITFGLAGGKEVADFKRQLDEMDRKRSEKFFARFDAPASATPTSGGRAPNVSGLLAPKPARGPKGPDLAAQAERRDKAFNDQMARLDDELLGLMQDITSDAKERARLEVQRIDNASIAYAAEVDSRVKLKQLNAADGEKLKLAEQRNAAEKRNLVARELEEQAAKDDLSIRQGEIRNQQDLLRAQADLADDREKRRDLELRLLDLAYQQEEAELKAVLASRTATEAQKKIAEERLKILGELKGSAAEKIEEENGGPLARYLKSTDLSGSKSKDAVESLVVQELDYVQDGIRNAITKRLGIKDPFLAGILDMFIQQNIMKPLAEALAGAGGGGGGLIGGIVGGIFGFASGGSMTLGGRGGTDTNRLSLNGRPIANVSRGETLSVGNKTLNSGRGGGAQVVTILVQEGDMFKATVANISHQVAAPLAQSAAMQAAGAMGQYVTKNMPTRLAQFQRDGT